LYNFGYESSQNKIGVLRLRLTGKGANVQESLWSREIIQGV
jgi:hypothetical protein